MTALIDVDGLIYKSVYPFADGSKPFELAAVDEFLVKNISKIINELHNSGVLVTGTEYYMTYCKDNYRKKIYPAYKANRTKSYIDELVKSFKQAKLSEYRWHDNYEADDLIAIRCRQLSVFERVIVTNDKDLTQLGGLIFNYYSKPPLKDEYGNIVATYPMKGLTYISDFESAKFLAAQLLTGDASDNIVGLHKVGHVTASKLLEGASTRIELYKRVIASYQSHFKDSYKEILKTNYKLIRLGYYYE